jgi:PIN domain nuclease of toxin-antitoxin system
MVLLDTHIWLWWLLGDGSLKQSERKALDQLASNRKLCISWTTLWETEMLERKGRITLLPDFEGWVQDATHKSFMTVLAADMDLILAQQKLPDSFHGDPADRLITTTAILSGYALATYDQRIRKAEVCTIWNGSA